MWIWGSGMEIRSLPRLPTSSPLVMYRRRSFLIRPRTICRKRLWSWSILRIIGPVPGAHGAAGRPAAGGRRTTPPAPSIARVAAGEDAGHIVQHVGGADVAVAVVLLQPALDDVDLLLGVLVHHRRDQRGQLDRILLVLEELQFEGLVQPLVGLVVER